MRTPEPIKAGPAIIVWLLAGLFCLTQATRGQTTCAQQVADIQGYSKKIDRFIKATQHSRRVFSLTLPDAGEAQGGWREFDAEGDRRKETSSDRLSETADVWSSQGRIVGVNFTFRDESRDWVQFAMYYYREDGTLARISAQLDMQHGEVSLIRDQFYDPKGILLSGSTKSCALKAGSGKKTDRDFTPGALPVYLTTDRLPFYQALARSVVPPE